MTSIEPLTPGLLIQDRYQIGHPIGYGGMGAVYEVIDLRLDARVALKQILRSTPAMREAFEREARLLANLKHRSLPKVSDHIVGTDADFLVMDFIDGPDLATLIEQQGALPTDQVLRWADALLDVLTYLHTRQPPIIHRDIKPQNIKIDHDGVPVLLDFGIAKGNAGVTPAVSSEHSVAAYSRPYAPIEQLLGAPTSVQSDLFSLGATLYHLLAARVPPAASQRQSELNDNHADPLVPLHQVSGRVPKTVSSVISHMLALHASDRPTSAAEIRERLRAAANQPARLVPPAATEFATSVENTTAETSERLPRSTRAPHPALMNSGTLGSRHSLQKRLHARVRRTLDSYDGAWLVWCDPHDQWRPLLERVADDHRLGTFRLLAVNQQTVGEIGGLQVRQQVQQLINDGESFVLLVSADRAHLGWVWAHALLAEETYVTSLRDQLLAWGWQPQSAQVSEQEIAVMARQGLQQDPATWGGGNLQPDLPLLLEVLAGGAVPQTEEAYIFDLTVQQAGLFAFEETATDRWRIRSLARLLVTQAYEAAPRIIGEHHELLIQQPSRSVALELLGRWTDSLRLSRGLASAIVEADKIAALDAQTRAANLKHGPFLSRAAELGLFTTTCTRLAQKSGKDVLQTLANLRGDLEHHAASFWGDASSNEPTRAMLAIPWSELVRLSRAAQALLDAVPGKDWSTPEQAINWYHTGGWQLDSVGEEFLRNLSRSTPELLSLITPLREAYRARWEQTLIQWSDIWTAANCPTPQLPTAGEWLKQALTHGGPTAVLMIDALRYDLGATLAATINTHEGTERAALSAARAPLPSITALGMGMALPIDERDLRADVIDGRWHLIDNTTQLDLSIAEKRRAWLRTRGTVLEDGVLALNDVIRGQVPQPGKGRAVVVITDDLIDQLGHEDELELMGSGPALERYRTAITQLRDAGWRRVLVVTDHGYIQWAGSDEKRPAPPVPGAAYRSRRALAYPTSVPLAEPHTLAPGGMWRVLPARGSSAWSAYGKLGYFHGGASLQEWIIPCLQITWPTQAQPVSVSVQAPPRGILSAQPRITLRVERGSMFVEDALPRHLEVLIRHATSRAILFRSAQTEVSPQQETVAIVLRQTPNVSATRDTALGIEVRDTMTEEVIAAADSVLGIDLDDW